MKVITFKVIGQNENYKRTDSNQKEFIDFLYIAIFLKSIKKCLILLSPAQIIKKQNTLV